MPAFSKHVFSIYSPAPGQGQKPGSNTASPEIPSKPAAHAAEAAPSRLPLSQMPPMRPSSSPAYNKAYRREAVSELLKTIPQISAPKNRLLDGGFKESRSASVPPRKIKSLRQPQDVVLCFLPFSILRHHAEGEGVLSPPPQGKRDAARVEHKENRRIGCAGEVVAARCFRCAAHAVIIAHHTLEDGEVMAFAVSREQAAHGFLACEEEVEIGPGEAEQLAVKKRIDEVRPAFERGRGGPFFCRRRSSPQTKVVFPPPLRGAAIRIRGRFTRPAPFRSAGKQGSPPADGAAARRNKPGRRRPESAPPHRSRAGRGERTLSRASRSSRPLRPRAPPGSVQKEAQNFLELPAASADESGVGRGGREAHASGAVPCTSVTGTPNRSAIRN